MFEEYFDKYELNDMEKASRKRMKNGEKALMSLVGEQPAKKGAAFRVFRTAAVGIAAAACLTVTAGAVTHWSFLQNVFDGNAEVMEKYVITDICGIVANTYENYDFEVVGLAHDDYMYYIAVDVIAKNGAKISDYAADGKFRSDLRMDERGYGMGSADEWVDVSEERATLFEIADTTPKLEGSGSFFIHTGESLYEPRDSKEYAEIRLSFGDTEKLEIALDREVNVPIVELRAGKTEDQPRFDEPWYIEKVVISGISVTFEGKAPCHREVPILTDDEKIYLLTDSGERIYLRETDMCGQIIDGNVCGTATAAVKQPVSIGSIKALVIGGEEVPVK